MADATEHPDRDARAVADATEQARARGEAQRRLAELSQAQTDAIVDAMARAAEEHAEPLARAAVEETGYGVEADKVQKNLFAARNVHAFIRDGDRRGDRPPRGSRVLDIAEPFGPVAAIVPSTNPTSTTIYKLLIALKARCAIVLSRTPPPSAASLAPPRSSPPPRGKPALRTAPSPGSPRCRWPARRRSCARGRSR